MKKTMIILFSVLFLSCLSSYGATLSQSTSESVVQAKEAENLTSRRIKFTFNGGEAIGILYNNIAADSLLAQLPLTTSFSDFANQEKIAYFPKDFTINNAPRGCNSKTGDICIYIPWGNLAIYYVDSDYSESLVPLGKIEVGLEAMLEHSSDFLVTVEEIK